MSQVFQATVLNTGTTGSQLQAVSQDMFNVELSQPEGTRMELILTLAYPSNVVSAFSSVSETNVRMAALVNTACKDAGVTPWPGATNIATPLGSNQIAIQWTKESAQILIVIGVLAALAVAVYALPGGGYILALAAALGVGFAIYEWINGWRFEKGMFVNVNTGQSLTPGQFLQQQLPAALGNPMFYVVGGGLLIGGVLLWRKAQLESTEVVRGARNNAKARAISARSQANAKRIKGGG